ncbi:hypothetical protein D3C72_189250 [compost metagenome]
MSLKLSLPDIYISIESASAFSTIPCTMCFTVYRAWEISSHVCTSVISKSSKGNFSKSISFFISVLCLNVFTRPEGMCFASMVLSSFAAAALKEIRSPSIATIVLFFIFINRKRRVTLATPPLCSSSISGWSISR